MMTLSTRLPRFSRRFSPRLWRRPEWRRTDARDFPPLLEVFPFSRGSRPGHRDIFRDADGGGMGSVCRSKRIDIHVAKRCEGLEKVSSFCSSPAWKRRFSSSMTSPTFIFATRFSMFGPMQSGKDHVLSQQSAQALGNRREAEFGIELAFWPAEVRAQNGFAAVVNHTRLMVGRVERIRVSSVICRESSNGTLKSARMMTRLPARDMSSIVCLCRFMAIPIGQREAGRRSGGVAASRPLLLAASTLMRSRTRHE